MLEPPHASDWTDRHEIHLVHKPCRLMQTNEQRCSQIHDWYLFVRNCACEPGRAVWQKSVPQEGSLEIQDGRLQSQTWCGEIGAGNIQITDSSRHFVLVEGVTSYGWHFAYTEEMSANNEVMLSFLLLFLFNCTSYGRIALIRQSAESLRMHCWLTASSEWSCRKERPDRNCFG